VVFEHIQNKSDALTLFDDSPYDLVPLGVYAQMMHGSGRRSGSEHGQQDPVRRSGSAAFNFVVTTTGTAETLATSQIGSGLVPDGAGKWRLTDGTTSASVGGTAWLVIEQVNPSTGLVEARLTF
jgi:hypothetical protein